MPALFIQQDRTGPEWQVWPVAESPPPGFVQETRSYLFDLRDAPGAAEAELLIDDRALEALRTKEDDIARWRWSPGFHAGEVEAELRLPGTGVRRFRIVTDPDLHKLTRDDFDAMIREILEDTFALFALSGFRKGLAHGQTRRPPPIARLEFLRSRIDELNEVMDAINRHPRRMLLAEDALIPHHRAIRATGPEIIRSLRSGRILTENGVSSRLPPRLKGHLPEKIRMRRKRNSLDLSEHRQMRACLTSWAAWLRSISGVITRMIDDNDKDTAQSANTWADRTKQLAWRVSRMSDLPLFDGVGDGPSVLLMSTLFRSDPKYRRFYRLYQDMNLGLASLFGDFLNMPLARTFELYELWCFLRLVRSSAEHWGGEHVDLKDLFISDSAGGVTIASGAVVVQVGHGWVFCFQRQYREFWLSSDKQGTFSRTMTPDIVVKQNKPSDTRRLILLDAKYRIDQGLNDSLNSIHTYRDALVQETLTGETEGIVSAAYLATPHTPQLEASFETTRMPSRLFHPAYRKRFRFGAVTMRPGMAVSEVVELLKEIVKDARGDLTGKS